MSSVIRSVLGAAILLAGASAAMAASDKPPVADQRQTGATTATVGATNAAPADKSAQTGATTATVGATNAPVADQAKKPRTPSVPDNNAASSGADPNSTAAMRAFFTPQY